MLTQRQQQALDFIADFQERYDGKSPTFLEIRKGLGLHSSGYVGNIVRDLEKLGRIRREKGKTRGIQIVIEAIGAAA